MARPTKSEKERRCRQTKIRLTIAEDVYLREQAELADLTVAEYTRRRALSLPIRPAAPKADARLLHELNAIGVNINQIARNLNSGRRGARACDWASLQRQLGRVLGRVGAAFDD